MLDTYETPEDAVDLAAAPSSRSSWESWANRESLASAYALENLCKGLYPALKVTLNESHIALGTQRQNFCWLNPRKKQAHCRIHISLGSSNKEKGKELLVNAAIPFESRDEGDFVLSLSAKDVEEKHDFLKNLFQLAIQEYS